MLRWSCGLRAEEERGRSVGDREAVKLVSRLSAGVLRFWRWWLGELAGCLPGWLRAGFGQRRRHLTVTVAEGEAHFALDRGRGASPLGRFAFGGGSELGLSSHDDNELHHASPSP